MINGESIGTLFVDIKANNLISQDFSKIMRDAEKSVSLLEKSHSKVIARLISNMQRRINEMGDMIEAPPGIYRYFKSFMELLVDDVEEKARLISSLIENISNTQPYSNDQTMFAALRHLLSYEKQIKAEQEKLAKDYYQNMKFEDDNYYTYRLKLINEEADLFKKKLGDKFDTAKFINEEMKKLGEELENFRATKAKNNASAPSKGNWTVPPTPDNPNGSNIWDSHKINFSPNPYMPNSAGLLQTVPVPESPSFPQWNREQLFKDYIEASRTGQLAFEAFSDSVAASLDVIHIRLASDASSMEKIWANMINSMIDQISMLVAKWAVLNFVGAIFGFGGINLGSFLGLSDPSSGNGGKSLGHFVGMRLASGGDFIVPPGFPNDSYPMLVQSGERVKVTPSGKVGDEIIILNQIKDAIQAQSLNQLNNQSKSPNINIQIDGRTLFKTVDRVGEKSRKEGWKNK